MVLSTLLALSSVFTADNTSGTSSDLNEVTPFLNVGLLGVLFVLLVSKKFIVTKYYADEGFEQRDAIIEAQRREIEEWKSQVRDLQKVASEQLLPVVVESVAAQKEYTKVLNDSLRDRQRRRDEGDRRD